MNHFSKQYGNKTRSILFMVLTFILLSIGTAFGQTAVENKTDLNNTELVSNSLVSNSTEANNVVKIEADSNASNMNFVLWFMGSKQDPNAKVLPAGTKTKKQFMTSGMEPNRLLIKAFLKKAINFESATV
jgi:hypothetical protein